MSSYRFSIPVTLTSIRDPLDQRHLTISQGQPTTIGRASRSQGKNMQPGPDNALFDCPVVSRTHAELKANPWAAMPEQITITDKGSLHGTTVNGQKIAKDTPMALRSGDKLQFGTTVTRGERNHDGVIVTFERVPPAPFNSSQTLQATSQPVSNGFHVPSVSDYESDVNNSDLSEDEVHEKSSAKTTPDQAKLKPGSQDQPIDLSEDDEEDWTYGPPQRLLLSKKKTTIDLDAEVLVPESVPVARGVSPALRDELSDEEGGDEDEEIAKPDEAMSQHDEDEQLSEAEPDADDEFVAYDPLAGDNYDGDEFDEFDYSDTSVHNDEETGLPLEDDDLHLPSIGAEDDDLQLPSTRKVVSPELESSSNYNTAPPLSKELPPYRPVSITSSARMMYDPIRASQQEAASSQTWARSQPAPRFSEDIWTNHAHSIKPPRFGVWRGPMRPPFESSYGDCELPEQPLHRFPDHFVGPTFSATPTAPKPPVPGPRTTRIAIPDLVDEVLTTCDADKIALPPSHFLGYSFAHDFTGAETSTATSSAKKRKADEISDANTDAGVRSFKFHGPQENADDRDQAAPPADASKDSEVKGQGEDRESFMPPARRRKTEHLTPRSIAGEVAKYAAGAVIGGVGAVALLCSPAAEMLINWLA